jgi:hypothetical protein
MDTNVRLVRNGNNLFLVVRLINVSIQHLSHEQLQTICTILKNRRTAAVPYRIGERIYLLTEYREDLRLVTVNLQSEDKRTTYNVELNSSADTIKLQLNDPLQRKAIEDLYMRRLQINILAKTSLKVISKSPNVYYETNPLPADEDVESDIVAYRRYYVFSEYFEGRGLGFGVDVGTSYFARHSVEEFFAKGNGKRFYQLKERQSTEYKGTLLYKGPNGHSRCYFERYDGKITLASTDKFKFNGQHFANSYEYFQKLYPKFQVNPADKVAFVSFKGIGTVPVPAKCLYLTVTLDNVSDDLNQQDKLVAQQKRNLIDAFWQQVVPEPFGVGYSGFQEGYYIPSLKESGKFDFPVIHFAGGQKLMPPTQKMPYLYKKYFLQKYHKLKESGCYYVPPTMNREIHFVFPSLLQAASCQLLSNDLSKEVTGLTRKEMEVIDHQYASGNHLGIMYDLKKNYEKGTVVFVFDNSDPSIYYTLSQELQGWKIIRLTRQELVRKLNKYHNHPKGKTHWESYISLNAFKIATELGCIPYIFDENLAYESQLFIDVSEKFSDFGLGLLIHKKGMPRPILDYIIKPNPDGRNDLINPHMLRKYLKELLLKYAPDFNKHGITKMLALRDGTENRSEYDVFVAVIEEIKDKLPAGFSFDFVEYHKKSQKSIRLFEFIKGEYKNPLEGSWLTINESAAILMNTGEGTLTQGTASPLFIKSNYKKIDLKQVLHDIFLTSQLNFSSPRVAQKLTFLAKRIDDLLRERRAQQIVKIK